MSRAGEFAVWIALLAAAWGASLSLVGGVLSRRELVAGGVMGVYVATAAMLVSCAALATALWQGDFALRYVATFTSTNLAGAYRIAALWAGPAGSLLCTAALLGVSASLSLHRARASAASGASWTAATLAVLLCANGVQLVFGLSPFARLPFPPAEGRGLDPLLRSAPMALHLLLMLLGQSLCAVPFAWVVSGLVRKRFDDAWFAAVRRWTVAAWTVLGAGITSGMWWAYNEASWRTPWSWDAAEVASALPWLTTGALAFVVMRRPAVRWVWTALIGTLTYVLVLGGMFVARGGALPTAHRFGWSVGGASFLWLAGIVVAVTGVLATRARTAIAHAGTGEVERTGPGSGVERAGRYILVAGLGVFALGLSAAALDKRYQAELGDGESLRAVDAFGREWVFTSQGTSRFQRDDRDVLSVALLPMVGGGRRPFMKPEQRHVMDSDSQDAGGFSAKAAVQVGWIEDVYVVLEDVPGSRARLQITFRPLVSFIWLGVALMAVAGLVTAAALHSPRESPDERLPGAPAPRDLEREAESAVSRARERRLPCENCGALPKAAAAFCAACGFLLEGS